MTSKSRAQALQDRKPDATRVSLPPHRKYKKVVKLRLVHNDVTEACACRCISHCSCDCDRTW
jgi:hypothetical protein